MAFRIDDFKSQVGKGGGFAMGNLFKIFLPPLKGDAREMNLLCKAASLPGRQITSLEKPMGLQNTKIAYGYAVDDITLTFHCLNDMRIREYFETWQNLAINQETLEVGYYNEYTHPVIIQHIKKGTSFPIKKKKLFDSGKLPSSIANRLPRLGPLDLAQGEFDLNAVFGDDITYTLLLDKAYPTTMNAIELSDDGQLLEVTVQLSYKNWKSRKGDSVGNDFVEGLAGELIRKFL
jgi:hypothetical protein